MKHMDVKKPVTTAAFLERALGGGGQSPIVQEMVRRCVENGTVVEMPPEDFPGHHDMLSEAVAGRLEPSPRRPLTFD